MTALRTIEFVGGPYCGSVAQMTIDVDVLAVPESVAGENVEYRYRSTDRVSVRGAAIVEYIGKRVVGACKAGE